MHSPVPTFLHGLAALSSILAKAEAHCTQHNIAPEVLLNDRLYPDMFPLIRQVQIACDHAKGAPTRLAGLPTPAFEDTEKSFAELQARIARTRAAIEGIPAAAFDGAEDRTITLKMRSGEISLPAGVICRWGRCPTSIST